MERIKDIVKGFNPIPEFEEFDYKRHKYVIQTAGGNGWNLDHRNFWGDLITDLWWGVDAMDKEEFTILIYEGWSAWVDKLYVYHECGEIAEFCLRSWEWKRTE
jgi:hypothetical protein